MSVEISTKNYTVKVDDDGIELTCLKDMPKPTVKINEIQRAAFDKSSVLSITLSKKTVLENSEYADLQRFACYINNLFTCSTTLTREVKMEKSAFFNIDFKSLNITKIKCDILAALESIELKDLEDILSQRSYGNDKETYVAVVDKMLNLVIANRKLSDLLRDIPVSGSFPHVSYLARILNPFLIYDEIYMAELCIDRLRTSLKNLDMPDLNISLVSTFALAGLIYARNSDDNGIQDAFAYLSRKNDQTHPHCLELAFGDYLAFGERDFKVFFEYARTRESNDEVVKLFKIMIRDDETDFEDVIKEVLKIKNPSTRDKLLFMCNKLLRYTYPNNPYDFEIMCTEADNYILIFNNISLSKEGIELREQLQNRIIHKYLCLLSNLIKCDFKKISNKKLKLDEQISIKEHLKFILNKYKDLNFNFDLIQGFIKKVEDNPEIEVDYDNFLSKLQPTIENLKSKITEKKSKTDSANSSATPKDDDDSSWEILI